MFVHVWIPLTFSPYVVAASALGVFLVFPGLPTALLAGVTATLLIPSLRRLFQGESPNKTRVFRALKFGFVVAYLISLGIFVLAEIPGLRSSVRAPRFEASCRNTQDPEACGQWAIHLIDHATHIDDVKRGHAELERLCKEGNKAGCRFLTDRQSVRYFYESVFAQNLERDVNRLCADGNMMACWILPEMTDGIPPMGFVELLRLTTRACNARPDFFACAAAMKAAEKVPNSPTISIDLIQWDTPLGYCHGHDEESWHKCCLEGNANDCASLGEATQSLAAHILGTAGEEGFLGVGTPKKDSDSNALRDACETGEMMECIAYGTSKTTQPLGLVTREEDIAIWETYLKAPCEAGVDGACLAYAIRVLDRPLDEPQDREEARTTLELACDRGSTDACWWLVVFFDAYEEHALARTAQQCFRFPGSTGPCSFLSDLVLQELGLHPWKINRLVTAREYETQCANGNPVSCLKHFEKLTWISAGYPRLSRRLYSEAKRVCESGRDMGCQWAEALERDWPL